MDPALQYNDCDLNCPRVWPAHTCCHNCASSRLAFYETASAEVKSLWDSRYGFWQPEGGCRLSRSMRPEECLKYDCADQIFLVGSSRWNNGWPLVIRELPRATATEESFIEQARSLWREMHERTILGGRNEETSWDRAWQHRDGPTIYVLHGMIGSGKSSWAKRFCDRHPRARIVSADSFRQMLHGKYEYHAEMDDIITNAMRDAAVRLLAEGYDVVIDCGNLTQERRAPWLSLGNPKKVIIRLPQQHRSWHLQRRNANPHWQTDWGKVYDAERASLEPLDEAWDEIIDVPAIEVMAKRILILSASPVRDKYIDQLIAAKLRKLGHEVEVVPCLRDGREKIPSFRPDVCIVPPIRNPNSRDFADEIKRFGCALVTRHTEPSCAWQDWKRLDQKGRIDILGVFQYPGELELVWSPDEADILNRFRKGTPRAVPVGAMGLDIYFDPELRRSFLSRPEFCKRYNFDAAKPTLLITSPWGFADSSPDLNTDDMAEANRRDAAGRDAHLAMTKAVVTALRAQWNILLSIHHGVDPAPYQALAAELGVPLDLELPMLDMLPHANLLIHAGSTAAVSAHILQIPALQFGDVNAKDSGNWWGLGQSAISRVSPWCRSPEEVLAQIRACPLGQSNANPATIKELEEGRYGLIDGKATDRIVKYVDRLNGRFRPVWPRSPHDYRQPTVLRRPEEIAVVAACHVCHEQFALLTDRYVESLAAHLKITTDKLRPPNGVMCPHCGARMFQL